MDIYSRTKRSEIMGKVRGRGNSSTELRFISLLREASITGWRRHQQVFGRPDFVFWTHRVAVFVDGCFWHGCTIHGKKPSTNTEFWRKKIEVNIARDQLVNKTLRVNGWRVVRIWHHELSRQKADKVIFRLRGVLQQSALDCSKRRI